MRCRRRRSPADAVGRWIIIGWRPACCRSPTASDVFAIIRRFPSPPWARNSRGKSDDFSAKYRERKKRTIFRVQFCVLIGSRGYGRRRYYVDRDAGRAAIKAWLIVAHFTVYDAPYDVNDGSDFEMLSQR